MNSLAPVATELQALPKSERRSALEAVVVQAFKAALLMSDHDELPLDANYFELGLTSLRVTEIKQRLEAQLGAEIDASVLFSSPTVGQLMTHLTTAGLPRLFRTAAVAETPPPAVRKELVDQLLAHLYES
jgi:acyl carrier protein